jgi:hypothetical protein
MLRGQAEPPVPGGLGRPLQSGEAGGGLHLLKSLVCWAFTNKNNAKDKNKIKSLKVDLEFFKIFKIIFLVIH